MTRSGDFARKTHFKVFFRALKLVFRAKREKLLSRRFLTFLKNKFLCTKFWKKRPIWRLFFHYFCFFLYTFWSHFVFKGKSGIRNSYDCQKLLLLKKVWTFLEKIFVDNLGFENFVNKNAIKTLFLRVFVSRAF